ncbi:MAG TPA: hypothetical protein VGG82_06810 [Casimicrobiaceae bacterium]|jgi:hypothetical protein
MRCLLLAFSLGIVMLQQQASLPSPWHAVYALLPALVAIGCAVFLTFTFDERALYLPRRERAHDRRYWWDAPVEGELASLD